LWALGCGCSSVERSSKARRKKEGRKKEGEKEGRRENEKEKALTTNKSTKRTAATVTTKVIANRMQMRRTRGKKQEERSRRGCMIAHSLLLTSERGRECGRVDEALQQKSLFLCSDIGMIVIKVHLLSMWMQGRELCTNTLPRHRRQKFVLLIFSA